MKIRSIISIAIFFILGLSCTNSDFKVSEIGLEYKFIQENINNPQPQIGDIVTIKMIYTAANGDVIEESAKFRTQLKKPSHTGGSIEDALAMMHKGDSAIFKISANDYYTKTRETYLPERFSANEKLFFYIKLINITSRDEFQKERSIARFSDEREEDRLLNNYLKRTNVQIKPTLSGLYFIELKKGNGASPTPGKKVNVHYLGYFIDGQMFDSSYDRKKPFGFIYGVGQVIQGWDEAIGKMNVGGKYKLIIPSHLAYGEAKQGPIPPNSTLIFEIELLDVEK